MSRWRKMSGRFVHSQRSAYQEARRQYRLAKSALDADSRSESRENAAEYMARADENPLAYRGIRARHDIVMKHLRQRVRLP